MLTVYKKKGFVYLSTIFELATTLKNLGVRWLSEKKNQFYALVYRKNIH